jgi:hypothetical protein
VQLSTAAQKPATGLSQVKVDALLADWRIYADTTGVPSKLRREIDEHMKISQSPIGDQEIPRL